jgi:hypothetical protein
VTSLGELNVWLRAALEFLGLAALSYGAYTAIQAGETVRILVAVGLPLLAAAVWASFRVVGDDWDTETVGAESRTPLVAVPGVVRLGVEAALFGAAVALLALAGQPLVGTLFGGLVLLHYVVAHDRVRWLLTGTGHPA